MSRNKHDHAVQLLGTVTVGPKGQVVIPVEARDDIGLEPGDKLVALFVKDKHAIAFIPETEIEAMLEKMSQRFEVLKNLLNK